MHSISANLYADLNCTTAVACMSSDQVAFRVTIETSFDLGALRGCGAKRTIQDAMVLKSKGMSFSKK